MELEVYTTSNRHIGKIKVAPEGTVKDIKAEVAKLNENLKPERQSIRANLKDKDRKDSSSVSSLGVSGGSKIYVKDLGPQISWRTVFVLEYLGPLVLYIIVATRPWIFYGDKAGTAYPFTTAARLALGCWTFHYAKRVLESIFVHRFSHGTMPVRNLYRNCGYYWGFATYVAFHVNHPLFTSPSAAFVWAGFALFAISELGNLSIHLLLRDLRPPGTTVRKIPVPNGNFLTQLFNYVSCPNYTYEFGAWLGFTIMTSCLPALLFAAAGMYQMTIWALGKHKLYKAEFKDYPKNRRAILPFVL